MDKSQSATLIQKLGAGGFGVIIGWYVYFINRYRKSEVQLSDLATLVGVLGGGAILALFPARSDLFGAYGIGLRLGMTLDKSQHIFFDSDETAFRMIIRLAGQPLWPSVITPRGGGDTLSWCITLCPR